MLFVQVALFVNCSISLCLFSVVKTTVLMDDIANFNAINEVYVKCKNLFEVVYLLQSFITQNNTFNRNSYEKLFSKLFSL